MLLEQRLHNNFFLRLNQAKLNLFVELVEQIILQGFNKVNQDFFFHLLLNYRSLK